MHLHDSKIYEINKVKITFSNRSMTAYGGFSLLASFFKKIKFADHIKEILGIEEKSPNGSGLYSKVVSYALIMFAGGERFSHILYLGSQKILAKLFGVKRLIESGTSLTRMFNKIESQVESDKISERFWRYLSRLIPWGEIKEDWLNFDSTILERYGEQEGAERGYNPKKKGRGSHCPLLGFLNRSKYVINLWNRRGDVISWNNIHNFFGASYERVKGHIKVLGVIADSGFYERKFIELLEEKGLIYIITPRLYHPLQREIKKVKNWREIAKGINIGEFRFGHKQWGKQRRYIVVRQDIEFRPKAMGKQLYFSFINILQEKRYRYSVRITNSEASAEEVWEQCKPRANDENTIKELKGDFALGGFCLQKFYATEVAMLIRILIYDLFVLFRNIVFEGKERTQRLLTLRYKYFVIPAQLGSWGRDKILRLSVHSSKMKSKIRKLYHHIGEYVGFNICNCNAFGKSF